MLKNLICVMGMLLASLPASISAAQMPDATDTELMQSVISLQLDAFSRDDAATAYAQASPVIQAKFQSKEIFMAMVRQGYAVLFQPQRVGILVSQANGCAYCTAAFCTILNFGLGTAEDEVAALLEEGLETIDDDRLKAVLTYALQVNSAPAAVTDLQIDALRDCGLTDKGIVQLTHVVSDFSSYNTLNLALDTDYDYRGLWRELAGFTGSA